MTRASVQRFFADHLRGSDAAVGRLWAAVSAPTRMPPRNPMARP